MDPSNLEGWIRSVADADVVALEPVGYGASNLTFFVTLADGRGWVARVDTGQGPTAGTELDLRRQAGFLRALENRSVRVPRLVELHADGTAMLMERAPGSHELPPPGSADREAVLDDCIEALAELHAVDTTALDLHDVAARPHQPEDHARLELATWRRVYETRRRKRHPVAEFAFALLHELAPTTVQRTVVCHGDVGPGNFLHAEGRVTALVDWEFAHIGDPMDDLGWWVFRGHDMRGDVGDLGAQLARWSKATGLDIDAGAIEFYRAVVMLRFLVCAIATVETGGSAMDRAIHNRLIPLIGALLPRSLARLLGITLEPTPPVADGPALGIGPVVDTLSSDLTEVVFPAIDDPLVRRRETGSSAYLRHLATVDRLGIATTEANARDVSELTRGDLAGGDTTLAGAFAQMARTEPEAAIRTLAAIGDRNAQLWPDIARRPAAGIVPIPPELP